MCAIALFLCPILVSADTLRLKSGQVLNGTWMGGDVRQVRFAVGEQVQTIAVHDIAAIEFGDTGRPSDVAKTDSTGVPWKPEVSDKQEQFCQVVKAYRSDVMRTVNEPNPIVRAGLPKPEPAAYASKLTAILGSSGAFDSWRGEVRFQVAGSWVLVEFTPRCTPPQGIAFSTARMPQTGGEGRQTLISLDSPVARSLSRIKPNQPVLASGRLFYIGGKGAYRGSPDNPNASVGAPRFLAQFTSIVSTSQ